MIYIYVYSCVCWCIYMHILTFVTYLAQVSWRCCTCGTRHGSRHDSSMVCTHLCVCVYMCSMALMHNACLHPWRISLDAHLALLHTACHTQRRRDQCISLVYTHTYINITYMHTYTNTQTCARTLTWAHTRSAAVDGVQAVRATGRIKYDIVLMDGFMHNKTGWEVWFVFYLLCVCVLFVVCVWYSFCVCLIEGYILRGSQHFFVISFGKVCSGVLCGFVWVFGIVVWCGNVCVYVCS